MVSAYLISVIAVSIGIYIYTVLGFGAGLFAMPLLLVVMDLQEAVALMSIMLFLFSVPLVIQNRKAIHKPTLIAMGIPSGVGVLFGVAFLTSLDGTLLKRIFGLCLVLYVLYTFFEKRKFPVIRGMATLFGFLGGLFAGVFTSAGPFHVTYINNRFTDAPTIRATIIGTLGITNIVRLPAMAGAGLITSSTLLHALFLIPFFLLSLIIGEKTYKHIDDTHFKFMLLSVLFLSGVWLLFS